MKETSDRCRLSEELEWMGIQLRVPRDWQIVRHSLDPSLGKLCLVDRRRERLTLAWTECRKAPDLGRLVSDYQARERELGREVSFEPVQRAGGWRGYLRRDQGAELQGRLVQYHAPSRRLLELLLLADGLEAKAHDLLCALANSVVLRTDQGLVRWRAFGVEVTTKKHYRLSELKVLPADVSFRFVAQDEAGKEHGGEAELRRMALAESWHDGDLRGLLVANHKTTRFNRFEVLEDADGPGLLAAGVIRRAPLKRLLLGARKRAALVWRSEHENAVYQLCATHPASLSDFLVGGRQFSGDLTLESA